MAKKNNPELLHSFGSWSVLEDGTLQGHIKSPQTGKLRTIEIYVDRLKESDLLLSLHAEGYITSWDQLMPAYILACRTAGIKYIPKFRMDFE